MNIEIDGTTLRSAALTAEGYRSDEPVLTIEARDSRGEPVHVRILGGAWTASEMQELANAAEAMASASERIEERAESEFRRTRRMAKEITGNRGGDAA
ncbi:MAG: hypothetical protein J2P19_18250 [Pseudonocardia sp.]|nr:hypothetical protein [Pseudonocardia sp.]